MTDIVKTTIFLVAVGALLTPVLGFAVWLVFLPAIAMNVVGANAMARLGRRR